METESYQSNRSSNQLEQESSRTAVDSMIHFGRTLNTEGPTFWQRWKIYLKYVYLQRTITKKKKKKKKIIPRAYTKPYHEEGKNNRMTWKQQLLRSSGHHRLVIKAFAATLYAEYNSRKRMPSYSIV